VAKLLLVLQRYKQHKQRSRDGFEGCSDRRIREGSGGTRDMNNDPVTPSNGVEVRPKTPPRPSRILGPSILRTALI